MISIFSGYEVPLSVEEDDFLDRWRVSKRIFDTIAAAPPDWSMRIGVHAKWGEGKTTVMRFLDRLAADAGYFRVWYAPWGEDSLAGLRESFAEALLEQLENQDAPAGALDAVKAKLSRQKWRTFIKAGAEANPVAKAVGNVIDETLIRGKLNVEDDELVAIAERLGNKRVIVFLDDLDRTDPALLPKLLLSLRGILDIPKFVFVLGFDDAIVARSLKQQNAAWENGAAFLDKILDFQFPLAPATREQTLRLALDQAAKFCDFLPTAELKAIDADLPQNPRKLKALIRHVAALRSEFARHAPDDISWVDVLFGLLIRLESSETFDRLFESEGWESQILSLALDVVHKDASKARAEWFEWFFAGVDLDPSIKSRIQNLLNSWRSHRKDYNSDRLRYYAKLGISFPLMTSKEYLEGLHALTKIDDVAPFEIWLKEHAKTQRVNIDACARTFLDFLIRNRGTLLHSAVEQPTVADVKRVLAEILALHELIRKLILSGLPEIGNSVFLNVDVFRGLLNQAFYWIHFTKDGHDAVRKADADLLLEIAAHVLPEPHRWLNVVAPWDASVSSNMFGIAQQDTLRNKIMDAIKPQVTSAVFGLFRIPRGLASLLWDKDAKAFVYVLFAGDSPLWDEPYWTKLLNILEAASREDAIHGNCQIYLSAMLDFGKGQLPTLNLPDPKAKLLSKGFFPLLWSAVISRPIQFRSHQELRAIRAGLIKAGVKEDDLPVPSWLVAEGTFSPDLEVEDRSASD